MKQWLNCTVTTIKHWNERLYSLFVECPELAFTPGQFTFLALDIDGKHIARPYSLVNNPADSQLEFFFSTVDNGGLSTRLASLNRGDAIAVQAKASGHMTLASIADADELWLIGTGTGIGPYISMLRTEEPWTRFRRITLVYGARERSDFAYQQALEGFSQRNSGQFQAIFCASREQDENAIAGRIQHAFECGELEAKAGISITPASSQILLCGHSGMIHAMQVQLEAIGLRKNKRKTPGHITIEKYW